MTNTKKYIAHTEEGKVGFDFAILPQKHFKIVANIKLHAISNNIQLSTKVPARSTKEEKKIKKLNFCIILVPCYPEKY